MNYYISDTHFNHENILKFDGRPFKDCQEMEEKLIENWNSRVKRHDRVYILGDFCWGNAEEWNRIIDKLRGEKVLILGNHDRIAVSRPKTWEEPKNRKTQKQILRGKFHRIFDYYEAKEDGWTTIMCHYPVPFYKNSFDPKTVMLHGHVHRYTHEAMQLGELVKYLKESRKSEIDNKAQIINVGCMMPYIDYTPRTLKELLAANNIG